MFSLPGLVPVTGAVDGQLYDAVASHVGANHLTAVPPPALVVPALLELDREPVAGLLGALHAHLSRPWVTPGPDGDDLRRGPGLDPQCGSDRSQKTPGANSPPGGRPGVSRNRISFATAALMSGRPCLPLAAVAVLAMALTLISALMRARPIR